MLPQFLHCSISSIQKLTKVADDDYGIQGNRTDGVVVVRGHMTKK